MSLLEYVNFRIYIYIWCSKLQILDIMNYFSKYNLVYEILVWCKTNPIPATNNVWLNDVEYCLLFREQGKTKLNSGIELKSKYYISPINAKDKALYNHPTIKPLELVTRHILHSTNENGTVLDCFMGSGTTGVACVNTKRNFIGMEIDKNYFESAKLRIEEAQEKQKMKLF